MGTLYARYKVENHVDRSKSVLLAKMLVDTGSDYRWIPATSLERIGCPLKPAHKFRDSAHDIRRGITKLFGCLAG